MADLASARGTAAGYVDFEKVRGHTAVSKAQLKKSAKKTKEELMQKYTTDPSLQRRDASVSGSNEAEYGAVSGSMGTEYGAVSGRF